MIIRDLSSFDVSHVFSGLREFLLLEYAACLMSHCSLWQLGAVYLDHCPTQGRQRLEALLASIPPSNEKKANNDIDRKGKGNDDDDNDENMEGTQSLEFGMHRLPETEQELDQVDEILANEFNNMSMGEREKVMFDVHGIAQSHDEYDPPNIEEILQQLECEIEQIHEKDAYNVAKVRRSEAKKERRTWLSLSISLSAMC